MSTNRLDSIATRQRRSLTRDVMFALCVTVATMVSITSVSAACRAATTTSTPVVHR
jgi:hypothetical protein